MGESGGLVLMAAIGILIVLGVLWALLGPRRATDESGHHVELARETERRDRERAADRGDDPDTR